MEEDFELPGSLEQIIEGGDLEDGEMLHPKEWAHIVHRKLTEARPSDRPGDTCTIFRVPTHIRQLDPEAYDPKVIGFGLFHHDTHSSSDMQNHKWRCLQHLLSRHGSLGRQYHLLRTCLWDLEKQDYLVRSCYSEEFRSWVSQKSALMMLLDGCFIICLMLEMWQRKGMEDETADEDESKKRRELKIDIGEDEGVSNMRKGDEKLEVLHELGQSTFNRVVYDVLKLENQIPFLVLLLLFDLLKPCGDQEIDLVDLALQLFKDIHPKVSKSFKKQGLNKYDHLFHLFYLSRIPSKEQANTPGRIRRATEYKWGELEGALPSTPRWTPSAMDLNRVGVKFKRNERADSFLNITFKMRPLSCLSWLCLMLKSGWMEMPPLQIYHYTSHLFRNLMAFEQCYLQIGMYIMTYVFFMDCIIDQAEDVRLLRLERILQHKLSSDAEAAELFNKLGSQIQLDWEGNYLEKEITEVIYVVDKFYEFKWHEWFSGLRRDYFGNPWTIISVLAAAAILLLTVEQAVFSAASYFQPS